MGNQTTLLNTHQCQGIINGQAPLSRQLELVGSSSHPYFGRIQVWKLLQTGERIFSKVRYGSDQAHKESMEQQHYQRCGVNHGGLLKYYGCTFYERYELVANFLEQHSYFEYPKVNLRQIIDHHRDHLNSVRESKSIQILHDVSSALAYLQSKGSFHGDIHTQSVFVDARNQHAKIIEHGELGGTRTGYTRYLIDKEPALLSPQLIRGLQAQALNPPNDWIKSDVYSLGMVMLELMTQESSLTCYDFLTLEIKRDIIEHRLKQAALIGYSDPLVALVRSMLTEDEQGRIGILELVKESHEMVQKDQQERSLKQPSRSPLPQASVSPIRQIHQPTAPQFRQIQPRMLIYNAPQQQIIPFRQHRFEPSIHPRTHSLERAPQRMMVAPPQRETFVVPTIEVPVQRPSQQHKTAFSQMNTSLVHQQSPQNNKDITTKQYNTPSTGHKTILPTPSPPEIKRPDLNPPAYESAYNSREARLRRLEELTLQADKALVFSKEAIKRYGGMQL